MIFTASIKRHFVIPLRSIRWHAWIAYCSRQRRADMLPLPQGAQFDRRQTIYVVE
jgi:hypothetical protein